MKNNTPRTLLTLIACTLVLASCASKQQLFDGTSAVANAPLVRDRIAACIGDDADAVQALSEPAEFFLRGYEVIVTREIDTPVDALALEFPSYVDQIPVQWSAVTAVLDAADCGPVVDQWRAQAENGWAGFTSVVEASERYTYLCQLYNGFAPIAGLISPQIRLFAPAKLPLCPADDPIA